MRQSRPLAALWFSVLLSAIFISAPLARGDDRLPGLVKKATPGIVTIVAYRPDLAMPSIGTGFFVAPDRVVTARHVLARRDKAAIRTSDGQRTPIVEILAQDLPCDLVMVRLQKPVEGAVPLKVTADAPAVGEHLFTISSPLGLEFTAAEGMVSAYRDVPEAGVSLQHTVAVSPGSSGCPILNDRGEVVGVQTGVITTAKDHLVSAGQALNFAVSAKLLTKLAPGEPRALAQCINDVPEEWVPAITRGIDSISLHPLTRDDFGAALSFFEQAAADAPDDADARFRVGLCQEKVGDDAKAAEAYEKSLTIQPDFPTALNNLGALRVRQGKYKDAADLFMRAIKTHPDYAAALSGLAVARVQLGEWPAAADAARSALRLDPRNAEACLNLGVAAAHTGDTEEAKRQYAALRELDRPRADRLKEIMGATTKPAGE